MDFGEVSPCPDITAVIGWRPSRQARSERQQRAQLDLRTDHPHLSGPRMPV